MYSLVIVNPTELIETLKDLKETRRLSFESEAMIKPFIGLQTEFTFSFIESSSTFGSRLGEEFKGGITVIAQFENMELECSILFPKAESEWVKNLTKDEKFTQNVTVIELDNLYQRVVFGKSNQVESEPVETAVPALSTTNDLPPELPEAEPQDKLEETEEVQKTVEEIEAPLVVEEPPISESEISSKSEIEEEKLESSPDAESPVEQSLLSPLDGKQEAKKESTISPIPDEELTFAPDEVRTDTSDVSQPEVPEITATEQGQENQEEQTPPPLPQNTEDQEPLIIDHHYLKEIRNKRDEYGESSLSDKEKEALKKLKENKKKVNQGVRVFFAFILMIFSLNSCSKGGGIASFVLFCLSIYLFFPFLKKLKEKNDV